MKPADLRDMTWEDLQARLHGLRGRVLDAWRRHGTGTTAEIARRAGISILTFRPRSTELYQLGLLVLTSNHGAEGVYTAVPAAEAREAFEAARRAAAPMAHQIPLPL